jgi:hypothetical protein
MRDLIERLENAANQLVEETPNSIYRRTPAKVKRRGKNVHPKLVARMGEERRTLWYETKSEKHDKAWYQRIKLHPRPNARRDLVAGLDVTMKCSCPDWLYSGAQWWALKEGYLFGLPRPKGIAPKLERNLKPRKFLCKHLAAVVEHMRQRKTKLSG